MILKIIVFGLIRMFVLFILSSGKLKVRRHYNEVYLWQNNVFFQLQSTIKINVQCPNLMNLSRDLNPLKTGLYSLNSASGCFFNLDLSMILINQGRVSF